MFNELFEADMNCHPFIGNLTRLINLDSKPNTNNITPYSTLFTLCIVRLDFSEIIRNLTFSQNMVRIRSDFILLF